MMFMPYKRCCHDAGAAYAMIFFAAAIITLFDADADTLSLILFFFSLRCQILPLSLSPLLMLLFASAFRCCFFADFAMLGHAAAFSADAYLPRH